MIVSIPSRGSGKGDVVVLLTLESAKKVSIPSRGSGKGDLEVSLEVSNFQDEFQSPLGEVVKETFPYILVPIVSQVSIPSRGSGKGD